MPTIAHNARGARAHRSYAFSKRVERPVDHLSCLPPPMPPSGFHLLRYTDDESEVIFVKQSETDEDLTAARNALEICPQNAIGDDGD